jgi:hypothetical protein
MGILHNLRINPNGVEQCDNVIYCIIKAEKRYTDEELRWTERCVFLYACRRLMHIKKYGTAKETEQMFNKVIKPTAPKESPLNPPKGRVVVF